MEGLSPGRSAKMHGRVAPNLGQNLDEQRKAESKKGVLKDPGLQSRTTWEGEIKTSREQAEKA